MSRLILAIIASFSVTLSCGQLKSKGTFVGIVPIEDYADPLHPKYKWYHLSELTFKEDSVYLEQSPIAIYKKDTIFSASDGGFYYYSGTIKNIKGKTIADLALISCDYCPNQFITFVPPLLVKDPDSAQEDNTDTTITIVEPPVIENRSTKYKTMVLERTRSSNTLLLDGVIYRRRK